MYKLDQSRVGVTSKSKAVDGDEYQSKTMEMATESRDEGEEGWK